MKGYVEKMIKEYPLMVRKRENLKKQIASIQFLSAEELISSMSFSHPDGERVQSSDLSDKTARIAMCYEERLDRINEELVAPKMKQLAALEEEIAFFEDAVKHLSGEVREVAIALFLEGCSWDELERSFCLHRCTISKYREQAIISLTRQYQIRESQMEAYMLG